jgi:hypothetical protein
MVEVTNAIQRMAVTETRRVSSLFGRMSFMVLELSPFPALLFLESDLIEEIATLQMSISQGIATFAPMLDIARDHVRR